MPGPREVDLSAQPSEAMPSALLTAVVSALAGVRRGDRVAAVGTDRRTTQALLAMAGGGDLVDEGAGVAVAGSPGHVPDALARLAPGGRLVAPAADAAAARALAGACGLAVRHVEPVPGGVAWSASRPGAAAPPGGTP